MDFFAVLIVLAVVVGLAGLVVGRYKKVSPSAQHGFQPRNVTPWGQFYRLWRSDRGKADNWISRTILARENGRFKLFPKGHKPQDDDLE
jgi:hypothetical protein